MLNKTKLLILLMITLLTAVACTPNADETIAEPTAVSEPEEVAAEPTDVPVEEAVAATDVPPAATDAPPAEATAVPVVAEPAPERFGILRFRDSDTTPSGSFQLLLEGIAPAPAGTNYVLWLVDDSFNTLNLGVFEATDGNVQFTGDIDQNLLAAYSSAFISVEPEGVSDGEIGPVAFNGFVPAGSLLHIRHVVTAFPANPINNAFLIGAQEQMQTAVAHTGLLQDELTNDNIREAQRHAEHVVNILSGESGASFGDLDGDTVAQNPGDGVGVAGYLEGAKQHTNLAIDEEDVTAEIELHAGHVLISSDNALGWIDAAITQALRVIASDSATEAQSAAEELARLLDAATNGVDANGDGNVAPIQDEGGIQTAYVHGQNMGSFEFFAADEFSANAAPIAPVEEAAPATEEVIVATEEPPAADAAATIDMANFAYVSNDVTVSVGTAVTWINQDGGPRHSATAADGSFDTNLFDAGEQVTITFDTPGTYVYYCTLHGSPDGSGMAATITVTE